MTSKNTAFDEKQKTVKDFFHRSESRTPSLSSSINTDSYNVNSDSTDGDSKSRIKRSLMICSEGFDKYTFDCHRNDTSNLSGGHDTNSLSISIDSSHNQNSSVSKENTPVKNAQPFTFPPVKHTSDIFSLKFKETANKNAPVSYKRVPEETLPERYLPSSHDHSSREILSFTYPSSFKPDVLSQNVNSSLEFNNPESNISVKSPKPVSDASNPIRNIPLSLNKHNLVEASARNMVPYKSGRTALSMKPKQVTYKPDPPEEFMPVRNTPLSLKPILEESGSKKDSSSLVSEITVLKRMSLQNEELPPVRNSPLSFKPILSKHASFLKKTPSIKNPIIKRDSVVHPNKIDMQGSVCIDGRFQNPWPTWRPPTFTNILKFGVSRSKSKVPPKQELDLILPIVKQNFSKLSMPDDGIQVTWIGHSTVLIQMHGLNILTDPIFSDRASPSQVVGPKRFRDPPCSIHDLPHINAVVISHSHYDHLDYNSVTLLNARFGNYLRWFVPLGLQVWMEQVGCQNVVELDWWEENCVPEHSDTFFVFTPAQHWSKRTIADDNKVLWGSWSILGPKYKFFFAGDTGYCDAFKQIGRIHGPFDLSAIPIGAYEPRWFMKYSHVNPEEAVKIHMDVKSRKSLAIHWGTFCLANEYYLDPPVKLRESLEKYEIPPENFFTMKHGESRLISQNSPTKRFPLSNKNVNC